MKHLGLIALAAVAEAFLSAPALAIPSPRAQEPTSWQQNGQILLCLPQNLVASWQDHAAGTKMDAFKEALAIYLEEEGDPRLQYVVTDSAFDDYEPGTTDTRTLVTTGLARESCSGTYHGYSIPAKAWARSASAQAPPAVLPTVSTPATALPSDIGARCAALSEDPRDPARQGDGVPLAQLESAAALVACEQAAATHQPRYQFLYARALMAAGRPVDAANALAAADESGYAMAAFALGELYDRGVGVRADFNRAASLYFRAAQGGVADGFARLGDMFLRGTSPDYANAAIWLERAAQAGSDSGKTALAELYVHGRGVQQDPTKAARLLTEAADHAEPHAMLDLGLLYRDGVGVSQSQSMALHWIGRAAEAGQPLAETELGDCYLYGEGVPEDHANALAWYMRAAQAGVGAAQTRIGTMYEEGDAVSRNDVEAVAWFRRAAANGDPSGMMGLANHLADGSGIAEDLPESVHWLRKAADSGFAPAERALGHRYLFGRDGVAQDQREAARWLRKAADQGDSYALIMYGTMSESGNGVEKDLEEARRCYLRVANGRNPQMAALAREYLDELQGGVHQPSAGPTLEEDNSEFWAKVVVGGLVVGAAIALFSPASPSEDGGWAPSDPLFHYDPPTPWNQGRGIDGLPCVPRGTFGCL